MRICPKCNRRFPDNTLFCPDDGAALTSRTTDSRPELPNNSDLVGRRLFGEYTISKKLGEGGMGAVYLARQNSIDQKIAVKVLHANAAESDEIVQRFHREARVISMLTHPNIIRVFIFGRTEDDLLYLAMEFVEGRTLREGMGTQPMDELLAIKIMKQVCSGLSEAHDLGIIHRDLKPDNILITQFRGEASFVKILDFGIAKLKDPGGQPEQKLTQAGIVYGTPEYLSPEQAQALELDHRTDIYSLGVMLYEFMTGHVPFSGSSPVAILTMHVFNEPKPPSEVARTPVAPTMERIIMKAMAKKPENRFAHAMDMFDALVMREQEILSQRGLDSKANWVPGTELTGMYKAVKAAPAADQTMDGPIPVPTASTSASKGGRGPSNGQAAHVAHASAGEDELSFAPTLALQAPTAQQIAANSRPPAAPPNTAGMHQQNGQASQESTVSLAMPQVGQPKPASDPTRKLIMIIIAIASFILLTLVGVIILMLVNQ